MGHRRMLGKGQSGSPVPTTDLAWWFRADLDAKIITANGSVTDWNDNTVNSWLAEDLGSGSDPVHNSAGGYIEFTNGQQGLQSEQFAAPGGAVGLNSYPDGFMMMVAEPLAIVAGRRIGGISSGAAALGSTSGNDFGSFNILNSGGVKLSYDGRLTSSAGTTFTIFSSITPVINTKYLLQMYVPPVGGTYFEIDGVAMGNNAVGNRFPGIITDVGTLNRFKANFGGIQSSPSWLTGQSCRIYEFIGYQAYDATAYAEVETYLKAKYSIP